jgi:hypothetical protein
MKTTPIDNNVGKALAMQRCSIRYEFGTLPAGHAETREITSGDTSSCLLPISRLMDKVIHCKLYRVQIVNNSLIVSSLDTIQCGESKEL